MTEDQNFLDKPWYSVVRPESSLQVYYDNRRLICTVPMDVGTTTAVIISRVPQMYRILRDLAQMVSSGAEISVEMREFAEEARQLLADLGEDVPPPPERESVDSRMVAMEDEAATVQDRLRNLEDHITAIRELLAL